MVQPTKKMSGLFLTVFLVALLELTSTAAGVEARPSEGLAEGLRLQPQGLNHAGIYALRLIEPRLTGSGVRFAVICRSITYIDGEPQNDYRPNIRHNCFGTAKFGFHDNAELPAGISPHSTAICSILFGEDSAAFNSKLGQFYYQGAAPQAQAEVYEFWHFLTNNVLSYSPPNVDIVVAGIGSQYEYWWTRGIESLAEHHGLIIVAGIGNGLNTNDPVLYPGAAANVIGVGVLASVDTENLAANLAHFALAYPENSSFGPTGDGRCKPDIVAPGNHLVADANDPNRYEPTGDWSSFSTPTVAGAIGLLVQKAKHDPNLNSAVSPEGGNCVMKAILLNSATKLPFWHKGRLTLDDDHLVPLDYIQGAGMLNAVGAYENLIAGQNKPGDCPTTGWDLNRLDTNDTPQNIYKITLEEPEDKFITVTATWNKHYSSSYPFEPLPDKDADFRLELWAVDIDDPNNDYLLDYSDSSVDNVEHIYAAADANYTNYEIVLSISDEKQEDITENQSFDSKLGTVELQYGLAWNLDCRQTSVSDGKKDDSIFWYDLNADGIVNESDLAILLNNLLADNKSSESYLLGDINTDGTIDMNDLQILMDHSNLKANWYTE